MAPSVSQLETIDTVTGKPTAVGNALPNEIDSQGLTTIDYMRKIFYLVKISTDDFSLISARLLGMIKVMQLLCMVSV